MFAVSKITYTPGETYTIFVVKMLHHRCNTYAWTLTLTRSLHSAWLSMY